MKTTGVVTVLAAMCLVGLPFAARADVSAAWNQNADGNWSAGGNWAGGNAATGTTGVATFSNAITANRTVTVDASPWTINGLSFANTGSYGWTVTGGTLNLAGANPALTVNAGSTAKIGSVLTGSAGLNKVGAGTLILTGANVFSGTTSNQTGTLIFGDGTTAVTNTLGGSTIYVDYGGAVVVTNAARVTAGNLTVAGNSKNCSLYVYGALALSGNVKGDTYGNENGRIVVGPNGRLTASTLGTGWHPGQFQVDGSVFFTGGSYLTIGATPLLITGTGTLSFSSLTMGNWTVLNSSINRLVISNGFQFSSASQNTSFIQTGGTVDLVTSTADAIRVGDVGNEVATMTVSGGILNATNSSTVVGYDGTGVVAVAGGTANFLGLNLSRSGHAGEGRVTLSSGTLNLGTNGLYSSGGTGAKTIALNGGTLGALAPWSSALNMTLGGVAAVDTTGGAISLSGVLSGAGALTKAGAGTLTLSGANTYAGNTTISAGTLVIGGAGLLGGGAYAGVISGSGALTYASSGTQTLLANNSYSGPTLVNSGALIGRAPGSCHNSTFTVASGATNGVKAFAYGGLQWTCAGVTYAGGVAGLDFDFVSTRVSTDVALLQINGDLTNNATVNITVRNGYWPATGTYPLVSYTGSLSGSGAFVLAELPAGVSATLVNNTGAKRLDLNVTAVPSVSQPLSTWITLVGGNASGTWGADANWSGGVPNAADAIADFSTLNMTVDSYVNNDAARTVGTLRFGDTPSADRNWFLTNAALTLATSLGQPVMTVNNQTATLTCGLLGTQGFYKDGAGTLTLAGGTNNNVSGPVVVREGVLGIISGNALKNVSGTITVATGASMTISDYTTTSVTNAFILCGTGTGTYGALDVWQNQTFTGPIALLTDARITVRDECKMNGTITAGNKNLHLHQTGYWSWATTFNGSINLGTGVLTLDSVYSPGVGSGLDFWLNAANLYSGGTVLTNYAVVRLGNAAAFGSGGLAQYPASCLDLYGTSLSLPWLKGTGGVITDTNTTAGVTTLTVNQSIDTAYAGVIRNGPNRSIAFVKSGAGALTLAATNTYSGATIVSNGVLGVSGTLGNGAVTVCTGSAFAIGATGAVGRATLNGTLTFQNSSQLLVDVAPPAADAVTVAGNVTIGSNVELRLSGDQARAGGSWKIVESTGGTVQGSFVFVGGQHGARLSYTANAVWLTVPSPGTQIWVR